MRLRILLAKVNPEAIPIPTQCSYAGCSDRKFHLRKASQEILASYGVSASAGASLGQSHLRVETEAESQIKGVQLPMPQGMDALRKALEK
jgi:hypothetical protein